MSWQGIFYNQLDANHPSDDVWHHHAGPLQHPAQLQVC